MTDDPIADAALLATDLDGTLLRPDGSVGEQTRAQLAASAERGVRTVFVTGRPPRWMQPVVAVTGYTGLAVCANGAAVVDLTAETVVSHRTLPPETVADAIGLIRSVVAGELFFAVEQVVTGPIAASGLHAEPGFVPAGRPFVPPSRVPLEQVPGVAKLLVRTDGDPAETSAVAAAVAAALGESATVTHASRLHQMLEISAPGVDKAGTLAGLVAEWGVSAEAVAAVGDMPNDVPMLRWAGRGFAVASAHADLLAVADEVIPDPQHDGVAAILQRMRPRCGRQG